LSELALVSARKTRLERLAKEGDQKSRIALELAESPDSFLSTIQIGITWPTFRKEKSSKKMRP